MSETPFFFLLAASRWFLDHRVLRGGDKARRASPRRRHDDVPRFSVFRAAGPMLQHYSSRDQDKVLQATRLALRDYTGRAASANTAAKFIGTIGQ